MVVTLMSKAIAQAIQPRRGKRCKAMIGVNQQRMMTMMMMMVVVMCDDAVVQMEETVSFLLHFSFDHHLMCG